MNHVTDTAPESAEDVLNSLEGIVPEARLAVLRNAICGQVNDVG